MRMKLVTAMSCLALVALSAAEPGAQASTPPEPVQDGEGTVPPTEPVETPITDAPAGDEAQDGEPEIDPETDPAGDDVDSEADQDAEQSQGDDLAYQRPAGLDDGFNGGATDNGGADGLPEVDKTNEA